MRFALFISICFLLAACAPVGVNVPVAGGDLPVIPTLEPELIAWEVTLDPAGESESARADLPTSTLAPVAADSPTAFTPTPWPGTLVNPLPGMLFRWNDSLWRIDAAGQPQFALDLFDVERFTLSDNGSLALLSRAGQVWVVDLSTGTQRQVQPQPGYTLACPAWWPNRPDIILALAAPVAEEPGLHNGCQGQPAAFNIEGEFLRYLASGRNDYGPLAASSDGKTIVFDQSGAPWLYRSGIGAKAFTPYSYNFPRYTEASFFYPEFSAGGGKLAWLARANINGVWQTGISVFRLAEKKSSFLYPYPIWAADGEMSRILWSPKEDYLALHNYAARQLWVLNLEGSLVFSSTALSGFQPSWSPTGDWLAYPVFSEQVGGFVLTLLPAVGAQAWQPEVFSAGCEALERCECSRIRSLVWRPDGSLLVMSQELLSSEPVNWLIEPLTGRSARIDLPPGAVIFNWIVEDSEATK